MIRTVGLVECWEGFVRLVQHAVRLHKHLVQRGVGGHCRGANLNQVCCAFNAPARKSFLLLGGGKVKEAPAKVMK